MFVTFAIVYPKPEYRDLFLEAFREDAEVTLRDEPGCRRFEVYHETSAPDNIVLLEVFDDEAAHEAHLTTPHYAKIVEICKDRLARDAFHAYCVNDHPSDAVFKAMKG